MKIFFKDSILSLFLLQSAFVFASSNLEVLEIQKQSKYQINKEFPGILLPYEQSKLAFQIPGRLELVYVDIGDKVSKGQVLAELDNSEITAQLCCDFTIIKFSKYLPFTNFITNININ